MQEFTGYSKLEPVHRGQRSFVFRGLRTGDGLPVVIKTPTAEFPSSADLRRLRHEFEVGRAAESGPARAHVVRHLALEPVGPRLLLILEDFGGRSLERLARGAAVPLNLFLELSVAVTRAVQAVHDAALVHGDINPSNVLYNPDSKELRLCDFSAANHLATGQKDEPRFRGTPAYASPEQSQRTGWSVDYRSDLYSLGVTLFEVLTGELPFQGNDALETWHRHLAVAPPSPRSLRADVPAPVAEVLLKLLSKNPDERYRSAAGLCADLLRCRRELAATSSMLPFELGTEDRSPQLLLPQRLYGRESAFQELLGAFAKSREGAQVFVLVSGEPGVGKSVLVEALREQVQTHKGQYCAGKFEPRAEVPYAAFASALRGLLRALFARPALELARWRERVAAALGKNGRLLVRLVPELERLVGPQPEVLPLEPDQAQARFLQLVLNLIRALAAPDGPLTIFLDDLQWADQASLSLLEHLVDDERLGHLLLIGAYRENEVTAGHPLERLRQKLSTKGAALSIALRPLDLEQVARFIADSILEDVQACQPLAELVSRKTRGNPFFVAQFLKLLNSERLIWFEPAVQAWRWDLPGCEAQSMTDNVGDLLARRIHRMPEQAQKALCYASCIGSDFALPTLALVLASAEAEVRAALGGALAEELITPTISDAVEPSTRAKAAHFRFLHDHVRQAAYASIPERERSPVHLAIARALYNGSTEDERSERAFQLLDHFTRGLPLVTEAAEKLLIIGLCLSAGRRAKSANAYTAALRYLRLGSELLGVHAWQNAYDLALALEREYAESAYLNSDLAEMDRSCARIKAQARTLLDKVPAYQLELIARIASYEMPRAIAGARDVLSMLGVDLPLSAGSAQAGMRVLGTAWRMRHETAETLLARPRMQDERILAATQILALAATPAYLTSPNLFPLVICEMLELTLEHGNSEWSADALLGWSAIQIAALGAVERGYQIGSSAPALIDRLGALPRAGRVQTTYNLVVRHWLEPVRNTIEPLRLAMRVALEHGDLVYASAAAVTEVFYMIASGHPLPEIYDVALAYEAELRRLGQERFRRDARRMLQLIRCLQGRAPEPKRLRGEFFDDEEALRASEAAGDRAAIASLSYERALLLYIYMDAPAALECCRLAARHLEGLLGTVYPPALHFLSALVRMRVLTIGAAPATRAMELRQVRRSLRRLARWAKAAPANQQHRVHLIQAELARLAGDHAGATHEYERAIELAGRHGYLHEQAMALECAGRFYVGLGQERIATTTLLAARDAWLAWGAASKAAALESEFSVLWTPRHALPAPLTRTSAADERGLGLLDVESIMKASQAIVSEIRLPNLVRRLIALAMENTGAQRGLLLLNSAGDLRIEAAADVDDPEGMSHVHSLPLAEASRLLPVSIVEYVARVAEPVLQADVGTDPAFAHDPYIVERRPLSILCVPLLSQGALSGIVYLENNRMRGAFTAERVEVLRWLSAQAAISLENARLYADIAKAHAQEVRISEAQARFVPVEFLKSLQRESIVEVLLGDHIRKEMSILFSDVRGFTPLMESMSPEQHIGFINGYLGHMEPPILEHGGFVDSYLGDAIMALFDGDADHALQAGIGMSRALDRFNGERKTAGLLPIGMGVGISSGPLTLGTIGGPQRIKCGVIGDPVNLASRIESLTKRLGCFLLVSHHTRALLRSPERFELRLVDRVRVKGKTAPITLFEVLDAETPARRDAKRRSLPAFEKAMDAYVAGNFADAERLFAQCLAICPEDGAAANLGARSRTHLADTPPDWDGIDTLLEK